MLFIYNILSVLKKVPLKTWVLSSLLMALIYLSPSHGDLYENDAYELLLKYFESINDSQFPPIHGFIALIISRLCKTRDIAFSHIWLARCDCVAYRPWMTNSELQWLENASSLEDISTSTDLPAKAPRRVTVSESELTNKYQKVPQWRSCWI